MFAPLFKDVSANPWLYVPAFMVLVFAGIVGVLLRRPSTHRKGLLFGVGTVAVLTTGILAAYGYSFVRLARRGGESFDIVWVISAAATGVLALWLWSRFIRLLRAR
jgi:hypothetical protein